MSHSLDYVLIDGACSLCVSACQFVCVSLYIRLQTTFLLAVRLVYFSNLTCAAYARVLDVHMTILMALRVAGNRSPWGHPEAVRANGTVRPADPHMPRGVKEGVPVVKGDAKVLSIAAASIIAKVTRDRIMRELDVSCSRIALAQNCTKQAAQHLFFKHSAEARVQYTVNKLRLRSKQEDRKAGGGGRHLSNSM